MILVTGGLGFIGINTARALLDLGESCVLVQRRVAGRPALIHDEIGERAAIEQLDLADLPALRELGRRHKINGVVHLAGTFVGAASPLVDDLRMNTLGLLNLLQAAQEWAVDRVSVASTIGVYAGTPNNPLREDTPLPTTGVHPIPAFKKCAEIVTDLVGSHADLAAISLRIGAIWGPHGTPESPFFPLPRLVHAAVKGEPADLTPPRQPVYADDGIDACYVKDCARAIALLQTAERLNHPVYNIGSGYATKNREVVAAIRNVIPEADIDLPEGRNPRGSTEDLYLDTTRLQQDTGFEPAYGLAGGIPDYIDWLRREEQR